MAWEVWWALVLGFTLSGIVQAWVPKARLQRALGGTRRTRGRARHRSRSSVVLLQLRGDRDRQVAVHERRELRGGDGVPVRLDESRVRARDRDVDLPRLGVHARRVHRRLRPHRAHVARPAPLRLAAARAAGARARGRRGGGPRAPVRRIGAEALLARRVDGGRAQLPQRLGDALEGDPRRLRDRRFRGAAAHRTSSTPCSSPRPAELCGCSRTSSSARSSPRSRSSARSGTSRSPRCCGRAASRSPACWRSSTRT